MFKMKLAKFTRLRFKVKNRLKKSVVVIVNQRYTLIDRNSKYLPQHLLSNKFLEGIILNFFPQAFYFFLRKRVLIQFFFCFKSIKKQNGVKYTYLMSSVLVVIQRNSIE